MQRIRDYWLAKLTITHPKVLQPLSVLHLQMGFVLYVWVGDLDISSFQESNPTIVKNGMRLKFLQTNLLH